MLLMATAFIATACGSKDQVRSGTVSSDTAAPEVEAEGAAGASVGAKLPAVDADSAYARVAEQVALGPRVPGTDAHSRCVEYITRRLAGAGAEVTVQDTLYAPEASGMTPQRVRNITGRFNAGAPRHVMLLAHYDTRPHADRDDDASMHGTPIDGANDGGSGVAVLLEIARLMKQLPDNVEVEMLFTDAEDGGSYDDDFSWCVGAQAWADAFDPTTRRVPEYAILLDMVGGENAVFTREFFSERYARPINNKVWDTARKLGYGERFANTLGGALNDDHIHIMRMGIPTIDIVESSHPATGSFNPTWHTLDDNLQHIDRATLKMVGDVVINTIFQ